MNWLKTLLAKFASASKPEETVMTEVDPNSPAVPEPTAPEPVDTNKLKALLLALGHLGAPGRARQINPPSDRGIANV
jgi:hypothetical protein